MCKVIWGPDSEMAHQHFHHIPLLKASREDQPDIEGAETGPTCERRDAATFIIYRRNDFVTGY